MPQFVVKNAVFQTSVGIGGEYPPRLSAEIAMVGKSNVGKSSLINCISNNNKLARTSQTPGKTRLINFFSMNNGNFYLVDMPGYGFARAPKTEQQKWGELIEDYLKRGRLTHIFLLLDIRHAPTVEDKQMFKWILYYGVPFTLVATKADKIPKAKKKQAAEQLARLIGAPLGVIPFSSSDRSGKDLLIERIGSIVEDAQNLTKNTIDT